MSMWPKASVLLQAELAQQAEQLQGAGHFAEAAALSSSAHKWRKKAAKVHCKTKIMCVVMPLGLLLCFMLLSWLLLCLMFLPWLLLRFMLLSWLLLCFVLYSWLLLCFMPLS